MPVLEMNEKERGFATIHREEVVRRVVRRVAAVLDLKDFGDRLDLSGVPDCSRWERNVLEVGCRQLGVYAKQLDSLKEEQALDIVREGHVVLVPHRDGDYSIIERQLGSRVEITTVNGSTRHGTVSRSSVASMLADTDDGVIVAKLQLGCDSLSVNDEDDNGEHPTPSRRFLGLLRLESNDIWTVVLFALVSGVLSLSTPLAVESLVNVVSWGTYLQPLVVLSLILLASLGLSGVLKVLQTVVVEIIQRRQFVRIVGDLAHRFPRAKRSY